MNMYDLMIDGKVIGTFPGDGKVTIRRHHVTLTVGATYEVSVEYCGEAVQFIGFMIGWNDRGEPLFVRSLSGDRFSTWAVADDENPRYERLFPQWSRHSRFRVATTEPPE